MKKIASILTVALLAFTMAGCSDFLDLTPQGSENSANYFNSAENGVYAVNGIYDMLQLDEGAGPDGQWMGHHHDFFIGDLISDDSEKGSNAGDYAALRWLIGGEGIATMAEATNYWIHGFWGVSRANYVLENLPKVSWDPQLRDRLTGEALFLRAYFYWYLVRMYGGVPLFTSSVKPSDFGKVKRASVNECYTQIAKDLLEAAELLPEKSQYANSEMGRATKGAAKALLARVYMYQIGTDIANTTTWQQVYDLTDEVIKSGEYLLVANYAKLQETEFKNNEESVFEIQMGVGASTTAPGSIGTNFYNFQGNRKDDSGWGFNNPTIDLYNAFETGDPRLSCTVYGATYNNGVLYGAKRKYDRAEQGTDWLNRKAALPEKPAQAKASDRNIRIIRYADVLLMHAEAAYQLGKEGEARTYLNEIRKRARNSSYCMGYAEGKMDFTAGPSSTTGLLPDVNASGTALLQAIWKERRVELAMEQLRFYDLIRTGRFIDVMEQEKDLKRAEGESYESLFRYTGIRANLLSKCFDGPNGNKVYVLPIPATEVQAWGIEQNKGYE
jgi:starch-binding outer membrane protein, SusD/RagB family